MTLKWYNSGMIHDENDEPAGGHSAEHLCPGCDRSIINRAISKCLYCGAELPSELLFTEEQIAKMKMREQALAERRILRQKEEKKRDFSGSGHYGIPYGAVPNWDCEMD